MPKFLQRLHYTRDQKPSAAFTGRPAIVQYHPQALSAFARSQGYVVAYLERDFAEHGASLAAGPAALDLLDRIIEAFDVASADPETVDRLRPLIGEAQALVIMAAPPEGAVLPNGTPRVVP